MCKKDNELLKRTQAGFILLGLSFNKYCIEQGIDRRHATNAIIGTLNGPKAKQLKQKIVSASRAEDLKHIRNDHG